MRNKIFGYILAAVISISAIGAVFAKTAANKEDEACCLAIIIDDFGYDGEGTEEILALDIPITVAVMPFSECTAEDVKKAAEAGKEVIVHMPMEAKSEKKSWVGDKGIFSDMSDEEIRQVVCDAFDAVDTAVGFNNHMGSAIMEDEGKLDIIMEEAAKRGMIFVDSLTTADSKGAEAAEKYGVEYLERTVFIDCPGNADKVVEQLEKAAEQAKKDGYAIAIGHVGPAGGKTTAEGIKRFAEENEVEFITVTGIAG